MSSCREYARLAGNTPPVLPMTRGPNISWLRRVRSGDNQTRFPACTCFALANWLEVMDGDDISDAEAVKVWDDKRRQLGRLPDSGLMVPEAFDGAIEAGWFNPTSRIVAKRNVADVMARQPVIAVFGITKGWSNPKPENGCLDHSDEANAMIEGYHCVLLTGILVDLHGTVIPDGPWAQIEQSWGGDHGYKGLVTLNNRLFTQQCCEIWEIIR